MNKICDCSNSTITEDFIDVTHTLFNVSILVKNTPVLTCSQCMKSDYKDSQKLYSLLKDAYRKSTPNITYSEESNV